jgi:hypothetical protein
VVALGEEGRFEGQFTLALLVFVVLLGFVGPVFLLVPLLLLGDGIELLKALRSLRCNVVRHSGLRRLFLHWSLSRGSRPSYLEGNAGVGGDPMRLERALLHPLLIDHLPGLLPPCFFVLSGTFSKPVESVMLPGVIFRIGLSNRGGDRGLIVDYFLTVLGRDGCRVLI